MERILIVDDEAFIRENLENVLRNDGYHPISAENGREAVDIVVEEEIDLVLLDLNLADESGLDVLRSLRDIDPDLLVIIITGYGTVESAVEALKLGAYDYIKKPFKADAIHLIVRLALETQHLKREVRNLKRVGEHHGFNEIVGSSPQLAEVFRQIEEVAKHENATVLLTGESGTGKELAARAVHNLSPRSSKPFVEINCGSLPDTLLDSELFGHEKGAFTDAKTRKAGLMEEANGGTVFLDEIGEMDVNLQVKLLRVLESRKIRRLGGTKNIDIDVRIVAATNKDLRKAIEDKDFREDLYYRLNVFPIHLPPLRERRGDIPHLLEFFIKRYSSEFNKEIKDVSKEALSHFMNYDWPGNVRELKNLVERICIMYSSTVIEENMLPREILTEQSETTFSFNIPPEGINLEEVVSGAERDIIAKALDMTDGNVAQTSRLLNVARGTLRYKIEKFGLSSQ
ncbi:sigma-54-dependent transcriptional regulator [Limisalsivibrio acetivorans]|uniref:sigma-54-dependent transcriptional regulator n=1 Tax=Limisalsivibrio acetivorans TaxID=1304888 RepID=UPI0003B4C9BD|nr:sigma-54 dependent transcriptional regulator [Limisalsivibrio acetivorans]